MVKIIYGHVTAVVWIKKPNVICHTGRYLFDKP